MIGVFMKSSVTMMVVVFFPNSEEQTNRRACMQLAKILMFADCMHAPVNSFAHRPLHFRVHFASLQ